MFRDARVQLEERIVRVAPAIIAAALAGYLDARAGGELFDRFRKREAVVVHQEAERGAVRAATETVIELLVGAHPERGGFLVMEGAASLEFAPGLLERYAAADQFDDVGAADQVVDEVLRYPAGHAE